MTRLRDGRAVHIRALRPGDREQYIKGLRRLSPASFRTRFFTAKRELSEEAITYLTEVDFIRHIALVAEVCEATGRQPAGVGRFIRTTDPGHAEVAITVADHLHGQGIGTILMKQLAPLAEMLGVRYFEAQVLTENKPMLKILKSSGYPLRSSTESGITCVKLALTKPSSLPTEFQFERRGK